MRTVARSGLLAALVSGLVSGCAMMQPASPLQLQAADSGKAVELEPGQALTLTLVSNHTTGYRWIWASPVNPVLAKVGEAKYTPSQSSKDGVVGAGGAETWTFQATQPGQTVLRMEYRRPWGMQTPALQVLNYPVTVD